MVVRSATGLRHDHNISVTQSLRHFGTVIALPVLLRQDVNQIAEWIGLGQR
jgi:hypothetical protein